MPTVFSVIKDDFVENLDSVCALVDAFDQPGSDAKTRVASVNSSVLLLAATYEEFIREVAKEYARWVVSAAANVDALPSKLTETAWKRTLEGLARTRLKVNGSSVLETVSRASRTKFDAVCGFISGDLTQEVFDDLIHNENNMRAGELNSMFKVSGLSNICTRICERDEVQHFFSETNAGVAHGLFITQNDEFFERRNAVAHSLNASSSVAPDQVRQDIAFFRATGLSLCAFLDEQIN
ncbi:MAG: MAE_28990/MAE_18760 family HEPN-like nuclease [Paracoccaceae bacterium]|nr:MAE_28990/MAE_18760 family HEPN-like nuclease [Paracoccaceae bacterium]